LTEQEAARRLIQEGAAAIVSVPAPAWWVQLARAFATPFLAVLLLLALISLVTDILLVAPAERQWTKVLLLATMIGISGLLRFWQEFRSQRAMARLNAQVPLTATVTRRSGQADSREGIRRTIPVAELVRGDLLHLAAGVMLPADVRFLQCHNLFVSQSSFTGESVPVEKYGTLYGRAETVSSHQHPDPLDEATLGFTGTTVVSGSATAIVVTTGTQTFLGAVANSLGKQRVLTSFDRGVNRVSWVLLRLMLVMVPIVFVLTGLSKGDWKEALLFSLAVAVGLTPEMLPLVVTASLAKGALAMAREQVIVKHLPAMQNLGAMDVLCTDKTGTLTQDQMTLARHLDARGNDSDEVLRLAYLNSAYQAGVQNLIDQAILEHWHQAHATPMLPRYVKLHELPFDVFRRRMSVVVQHESAPPLLICKGALEEVLEVCSWVEEQGERYPLDEVRLARIERLAAVLNQDGLRVIAVASEQFSALHPQYSLTDERDLVFGGMIGLLDPPKPSARKALQALHEQGIAVKILTGDHGQVAARICEELGLDATRQLLGREMEGMGEEELAALAEQTTVFARLTPLHKARVIRALQSRGHTVGYLGDGLNDVAALHEADVSVSVDTAVDAAKAAADLILLQKSLLVLAQGVLEGRRVFGNIIKYLKITLASNFSNALSILVASAVLPFLPMLSLQLLVQNLLYDCAQLALPWDHVDPESVARPRPWNTHGLVPFMLLFGPLSSLFDFTTFVLLWFLFRANSPQVQALFQSGWFLEGVLSQLLIVQVLRTQRVPFFQRRASWLVLLLTGMIMGISVLLPFTAFGTFLGLQPLPPGYFPWLLATLLVYGGVAQVLKHWYLRRFGSWL
jgi:Mg2+-importing ATPase